MTTLLTCRPADFDDFVDFDDFTDFVDLLTLTIDLGEFDDFAALDDFVYLTDFDDFTVQIQRKSKLADQINYAALLLYFADLAYSHASSMSALADRVNIAALPLNLRIPTNSVPIQGQSL